LGEPVHSRPEGVAAAKQFPVNPGELVEVFQELLVGRHALASLQDLSVLFEEEGAHLPLRQAAAQVEKGAVFFTLLAVAIGAAAFEESLQERGVKGVGWESQRAQEMGLALAQGEGGEAFEVCLTHILSKIPRSRTSASENENGSGNRKRFGRT
jgi:hypothetical protein